MAITFAASGRPYVKLYSTGSLEAELFLASIAKKNQELSEEAETLTF